MVSKQLNPYVTTNGLVALLVATPIQSANLDPAIPAFVENYCIDCHDSETEKGDRNFEPFLDAKDPDKHHQTLEEILEQLNLGEMPPAKKGVAQPDNATRRKIVEGITRHLTQAEAFSKSQSTVLRRLTRYEYKYTLRDLLGIDTAAADMTRDFPAESRTHGFANLASAQALSDHQLGLYMDSALKYLDMALVFGQKQPQVQRYTFKPLDLNGSYTNPGAVKYRVCAKDGSHLDIAHGYPVDPDPTYPKAFSRKGVPVPGHYKISVKANAIGRKHPYDPSIFPNDLSVPLQLGLWHVPNSRYLGNQASEGRVLIDVYDLPDNEPTEVGKTVWMPAGSIPFVHWINGPGSSKRPLRLLTERYHTEAIRKTQAAVDQLVEQGLPVPKDALFQKVYISDVYQGPRIRIFEISVEGPLHPSWPPPGHRNIIGEETDATKVDIPSTFEMFATKAFRQPVDANEVRHYIEYTQGLVKSGISPAEAIRKGLAAILTSPRFLLLDEGDSRKGKTLDSHQLANRLSYALWSSMPDAHLSNLAKEGKLDQPQTLAKQIDRLLDNPKSEAFIRHFADTWLSLYKIGSMPPGELQYPAYFRDRLEAAMKEETHLFLTDIVKNNRPIDALLNSRETFLNGNLAKHYGLKGINGAHFRKVSFPNDLRRSGILGHASVLTATSNGVETSPVVRGVWVLENILGTPPPPPPPDVPPIEPDTRGATTIREQLAKHRSVAACADCHAKIDPWGFALEYYDPVGGFRKNYPILASNGRISPRPGKLIDGSGELPDGTFISDESSLRKELLQRKEAFTKNLIRKFLTYATGRETNFRDEPEIQQIANEVAKSGYGFRDLIQLSLQSEAFRNR
jgi:hypothetical protein